MSDLPATDRDGTSAFYLTYLVPWTSNLATVLESFDAAACEYITATAKTAGRDIAFEAESSDAPEAARGCVPAGWRLRRATVWVDEFDVVVDLDGDMD